MALDWTARTTCVGRKTTGYRYVITEVNQIRTITYCVKRALQRNLYLLRVVTTYRESSH